MDVLFRADLFQLLGPHTDGDLTEVRRAQEVHKGPGLADAPADLAAVATVHVNEGTVKP